MNAVRTNSVALTTPPVHPLDGMFARATMSSQAASPQPAPAPTVEQNPPPTLEASPLESVNAGPLEAIALPASVSKPPTIPEGPPQTQKSMAAVPTPITMEAASHQEKTALDSETLRAEISAAMVEGGHETAGALFEAGTWEWNGTDLRIMVAASKTLLGLVYTAQAQQIVRDSFRKITGSNRTVRVEPGDPALADTERVQAKPASRDQTDANARPQDHPLVRHAQELFRAEVRSVVSLRDSR